MTTTPPPEGTTEPRGFCTCHADRPRATADCGIPEHRPSPPAPAAEDDAVERAARAIYEHGEVSEDDDGTLRCDTCDEVIDGSDESRDGAAHQARKALDAAGVSALRAEVERLTDLLHTVANDAAARDARAEAAEAEVERLRATEGVCYHQNAQYLAMKAERDEARRQVADLRARIERVEALTEGLLTAEGWNDPEVDTVLLIQRRYRAVLAGSGDVESPAPNVATSEGRDKAAATSGEQPGPLKAGVMALTGLSSDEVDALGGVREDDRPAPVAPDSTGLREAIESALKAWALDHSGGIEDNETPAWKDATDVVMGVLAVVGQGVTAEQPLRERIAAEIIDVRRTRGDVKGSVGSLRRYHVDAALHDAAYRVLSNVHGEDEYPGDWLSAVVRSGEQGGEG